MRLEGRHDLDGRYALERKPDGLYTLWDGACPLYSHQSRQAVMHYYAGLTAAPEPVAPSTASQTLLNDTVAHIVNVWGPYEMPRFGLRERVLHNPSGTICRVVGFYAWTPPIILYGLEEDGGATRDEYASVTELSHVEPDASAQGKEVEQNGS